MPLIAGFAGVIHKSTPVMSIGICKKRVVLTGLPGFKIFWIQRE
jgi:hypothetical protein